jgi:excisionase family DNA binding protein
MDDALKDTPADCSTIEAARLLGMAVRSVQLMVDRGELQAWKTPGGHRRISRQSVTAWLAARRAGQAPVAAAPNTPAATANPTAAATSPSAGNDCILVIEDSKHYQNLVSLLVREHFPELTLTMADDGVVGLALAGQLQPRVLVVDILLPGIDGATLIMSLRSHPQFAASRLIVITSLDDADRAPYRFALEGVTVVHKSRLVTDLPQRLREVLATPVAAAP